MKITERVKQNSGFTLIELLVVISIIGLLASVVLVSVNSARQKSRDAKRVADINQMAKALEMYFHENSHFPINNGGGIMSSSTAPGISKFLLTIPQSPLPEDGVCTATGQKTSNVYWYESDLLGTKYTITFCLGPSNPGNMGTGIKSLVNGSLR